MEMQDNMALTDKVWHVSLGGSYIGTLTPSGTDGQWTTAAFAPGEAWGNFAPWFAQAFAAFKSGDNAAWQGIYQQITMMGLAIAADDGESYSNPTLHIDGASAWFAV